MSIFRKAKKCWCPVDTCDKGTMFCGVAGGRWAGVDVKYHLTSKKGHSMDNETAKNLAKRALALQGYVAPEALIKNSISFDEFGQVNRSKYLTCTYFVNHLIMAFKKGKTLSILS